MRGTKHVTPTNAIIGCERVHLDVCTSTQDEASRRARDGAPEGLAIIADQQIRGRGRLSRPWTSPRAKGIYASVVFRAENAVESGPKIAMLTALAAVSVIEKSAELSVSVKWPNDIIIGARKIGGVLAEAIAAQSRALIVGVGINVNFEAEDFPVEVRESATSLLLEAGCAHDRERLTNLLLDEWDERYRRFLDDDGRNIVAEFCEKDITLHRGVRIISGTEILEGIAEHINETGALCVRLMDGSVRTLVAGDVSVAL